MGIDSFQPWLKLKWPSAFANSLLDISRRKTRHNTTTLRIRRVLIDLNALIHNVAGEFYSIKDEDIREDMKHHPTKYWLGEEYVRNIAVNIEAGGIPGLFDKLADAVEDIVQLVNDVNADVTGKVIPFELLYLAADGVVPKAKLMQQRKRTYNDVLIYGDDEDDVVFDRTQIKPGTEFMIELSSKLWEKLKLRIKQASKPLKRFDLDAKEHDYAIKFWPKHVEFSDASQAGEGEHKIMIRMKQHPSQPTRDYKNSADLFYSPDSDMAILTMIHTAPNDISIVMRESHEYTQRDKTIDNENDDDENETEKPKIDRWTFYNSSEIREDLKSKGISAYDFLIISIPIGNDFMPGMPFSRGDTDHRKKILDALLFTFVKSKVGTFFDGKIIMWDRLAKFIDMLQPLEEEFLESLRRRQITNRKAFQFSTNTNPQLNPQPTSEPDTPTESTEQDRIIGTEELLPTTEEASKPINNRIWYNLDIAAPVIKISKKKVKTLDIAIFEEFYRREVSGTYIPQFVIQDTLLVDDLNVIDKFENSKKNVDRFDFDVTNDMVINYLAGIKWIANYYINQFEFINVNWAYTFHYAPTAFSLDRFLYKNKFETTKTSPSWEKDAILLGSSLPTPIEHLITILPTSKLHLLPKIASDHFTNKMPENYPQSFEVDWTFVEFARKRDPSTGKALRTADGKGFIYEQNIADELRHAVILYDFPSMARINHNFQAIANIKSIQERNNIVKVMKKRINA